MNLFAFIFILSAALIGLIATCDAYGDLKDKVFSGLAWGGISLAVVLATWALLAGPYSNFQKDICQDKAQGYGLEHSEWSFRLSCRVSLPSGQLVPEDRIRITSDGDIIVAGDEG